MFFLPVMLLLLSGGSARVVQDFQWECGQFFAYGVTPTVFTAPQFRQICQTLNNEPYFATLYDTNNKIPVYSAYKFVGKINCERSPQLCWYTEPQLEIDNPNMAPLLYQASNEDYQYSGYHKGHLAPVSLANSQGCADATFTLTNAAPQNPSFNSGQWRMVESNIKETLSSCTMPAYIVTGVVPSNDKINNKVNVPSYFWTAYCCEYNGLLFSGGVIGINNNNRVPVQMNVIQLESNLEVLYGVKFTVFNNNCRNAFYVPVEKDSFLSAKFEEPNIEDRKRVQKHKRVRIRTRATYWSN